jgi:hypothetical protein
MALFNRRRPIRRPAEPLAPVLDPAGWTNDEVSRADDWVHRISADEIGDLDRAVALVERRGLPIADVTRDDFALPVLAPTLAAIRDELLEGRGFALLRGVPVHRYTRLQSAIAFWGMGIHLGVPVSQNAKGHLMGHVTYFTEANDASGRRYYSKDVLPWHCDGVVDVIGLLCLHPAKSGGESAIVSSVTVHNAMLERRPDLVAAFAKPFPHDRYGEIPVGAKPFYEMPMFTYHSGYFSASYHGFQGTTRPHPGVPPRSPEVDEAIALFDQLASKLCFTMTFQQGDVQWLHNHVIVHSRKTAVEDYPEPERKRHLLRLRMMTPGGRPLSPAYLAWEGIDRDGVVPDRRHSGAVLAPGTVLRVPLEPE